MGEYCRSLSKRHGVGIQREPVSCEVGYGKTPVYWKSANESSLRYVLFALFRLGTGCLRLTLSCFVYVVQSSTLAVGWEEESPV